ncbi:MAG: helix-turn-helix domain-containing protein [Myxococcota bacterium]|jgi:excisionase family DNA binding protein|nr:helix-turn-helix domain-containing protein [Myxococcota bacterium]
MSPKNQDRVLSVKDVSEMCQVSNETIRRWIRKHGLKAYNTTAGLAIKILEGDLRKFAEELNVFVDWGYLDKKPE